MASETVTSEVGPFSAGPMVTTTLLAFPIAFAIDSASSKVESTAFSRFDSSEDMICHRHAIIKYQLACETQFSCPHSDHSICLKILFIISNIDRVILIIFTKEQRHGFDKIICNR